MSIQSGGRDAQTGYPDRLDCGTEVLRKLALLACSAPLLLAGKVAAGSWRWVRMPTALLPFRKSKSARRGVRSRACLKDDRHVRAFVIEVLNTRMAFFHGNRSLRPVVYHVGTPGQLMCIRRELSACSGQGVSALMIDREMAVRHEVHCDPA